MSAGFVLYDDAIARAAEPLALTRPFGELRAGALLIRERWERLLGADAAAFVGAPHLATFDEFGSPGSATGALKAGTIVVNARFAPGLGPSVEKLSAGDSIESNEGLVAAVCLPRATPLAEFGEGSLDLAGFAKRKRAIVPGWWMGQTWDLVRHLPEMLKWDVGDLASAIKTPPAKGAVVLGEHPVAIAPGAFVEPHVVFDTTAGAVVVMEGARIGAFARIAGPSVIGAHTQVAGGRYSCISVGEHSRICGEMTVVSVQGHANKGHDGFVGHSVLGRWSNLGAGTTTSNLKNNYGKIRVQDSRGEHDTGMQFLGSLIGDHAKSAIGTRLNTGTIVGAGANVFGDRAPAKFVPPFAWGDVAPFKRYDLDKFLEVAAHVMQRRDVKLSPGTRAALAAAWESTGRRRTTGRKKR
jgi:UDP-N-acetylglucosamine diphosphorylase/glucosamine-1-phosphate N-acetyltransferase